MTEYQTHAALVESLEAEVTRLRAVNAELRASIQAPVPADTRLAQAARQALEALKLLLETLKLLLGQDDPGEDEIWVRNKARAAVTSLREALEAAPQPSVVEQEPVAWQPIETAPSGKTVLVHYKNRIGNGRTMRACYYLPDTLESDTTESGWADEGWYEASEAYEYLIPLDGEPTHWMPLPQAPDAATPRPARQPLTDKQIQDIWCSAKIEGNQHGPFWFARAIERAHGIEKA